VLDYGSAMKTDSNGNLYVAGQFNVGTVDFDPTSGVDNQTNTLGGYDIFLTKINADGTYGWTRTWGGTGNDATYNLAFDSSNNVYIVGEFWATVDFDPGVADVSYTSAGSVDIFLSKFDTNGNFLSVKVMGEASHDRAHGVVINSTGEIFIAGKFNGTLDFDPSGGVDNKVTAGNYDGFLTKFNADETYGWTKTWGSTDRDTINDLQLGTDGSIYLAGVYRLTVDFDPSGSVDNQTSVGLDDPFLTKLNADGSYAWTKTWGSTLNDFSFNLRVNSSNEVYIIGSFQGTVDFDPSGATNSIVSAGQEDAYVSKFDSNGNYIFTRTWGNTLMDAVLGITIDTSGNYFIGGYFNGTQDLDPTSGTDTYVSTGAYDMFVSMFDASDNYITSKTFGSSTETNWWDDQLYELHAYRGTLNVTGNYVGTADFDPTSGTDTKVAVGSGDFFRSTYTTGYVVSFDAQGGDVSPNSKAVTYYSAVGSLPTPTRSDYSFVGWNTASDGSGTTYTDSNIYLLNTNLTLYADFELIPVSTSSNSSGRSTVQNRYANLMAMGKIQMANELRSKFPNQFPTEAIIVKDVALIVSSSTITTISSSQAQDSTSAIFTKPLSFGMTSNDVSRLQILLAIKSEIYPEGLITGYFGQLTKKAVQKFQLEYGVVISKSDSGLGFVGPKTRTKLQEIFGN